MKNNNLKMNLPSLDSLFTTQEERDNPKIIQVTELPINLIKDFPNHPFKVIDDEYMDDMIKSVKARGVIMPAIVRKEDDGSYCMISGHRRKHAAQLAGLDKIPCIVMRLTDDEATILMVDTNIHQRLRLLPSEKAFAYKMKLDAIKHQGKKLEDTSRPLVEKLEKILSADIVGKEAGFDGNFTYGMENISTNKRNLMNPDELLKLDNNKEIVIVRGRKPFICNKYDYSKHSEADKLEDMTLEEQKVRFKDNIENEKNKQQPKKVKYSFKDF